MKRFVRREVLLGAVSCATIAGCLGDGESGGGESGDDGTDHTTDKSDEEATVEWTYDVGVRLETIRDGILYGTEDWVEGSGGVIALEAASGESAWTYGEAGGYSMFTAPVVEDAVYVGYGDDAVGSGNGELAAVELDGTERWTAETGSVYDPPRLSNEAVYAGSDDGHVYSFEADSGDERWSFSFDDDGEGPDPRDPSVETVANGVVYVTLENAVHALEADDGEKRWSYRAGDDRITSAAVDGSDGGDGGISGDRGNSGNIGNGGGKADESEIVYLTTREFVGAISEGEERWTHDLEGNKWIRAVSDDAVYVEHAYDFYAFDAEDGDLRWREELDDRGTLSVDDETVYVGTDELRSLSIDGEENWSTDLGGDRIARIAVDNDSIYAATDSGVHRLTKSGDVVSTIEIPDVRSLVVGELVFVGTRDGAYALDL